MRTTEHDDGAARLFLVHEWFDPGLLRWAGTSNQPGKAGVKAVTVQAPGVHVHLLMQLHMNGAMIRDS